MLRTIGIFVFFILGLAIGQPAHAFAGCEDPVLFSANSPESLQQSDSTNSKSNNGGNKANASSGSQSLLAGCGGGSVPPMPYEIIYASTDNNGSFSVVWNHDLSGGDTYRLEEQKNSGSWVQVHNSSFMTKSLSGRGDGSYKYRVKACNSVGCSAYKTGSNTLVVRNLPSTPSAPGNINSTSTSFTLSWSKPSGTVSFYSLQERVAGGSWSTIVSSTSSTSYTRTGRSNNTNYEYRVRACNGYTWSCSGYGSANSAKVRLKPSTPSAPSRPSTSTGSAAVSWVKPSGTVTYYDLQKRNNNGSWATAKAGDTNTSETVSGLTDGAWDFRVRACNGYSWACSGYSGASSDTTVRVKPSTPSAPARPSTSTGSAAVNWAKPSGAVSYYDLQKRNNNGSWVTAKAGDTGTSETVSGLTDGAWDFRVRACNGYSWSCSSYSTQSSDTTVRLKPSNPAAPTNVNSTSTSFTVSWTKPSGTVTYYNIQERVSGGSWATVSSSNTSTSLSRSGKSNNTAYEYRVQACNGYSWSCSSYGSANSIKVELKPSAPATPAGINTNSTGYTVSWTKPSGTVNYYDLQERVNSGSWSTIVSGTTATSRTFSGKSNNTNYQYRVRACNSYSWACSSYSGSNSVKVELKPSVAGKPSDINSTSTGYTVSWTKPSGTVTYYNLQERISGGGWSTIASSLSGTSHTLSGKANSTNYEYRVQACNSYSWACANYGAANSVKVRLKPSTPAAPSRPSTSNGSAAVSWSAPSGTSTYYDLQKRQNNGTWVTAKAGDTNTSETVSGLTDGAWDFRVRGCNQYSWACSSYSGASSDTTVRLKPSTPAKPTGNPSTDTDGAYSISWTKPSGTVTVYDLQERKDNGGWTTIANDTTATSKSVSGKSSGDYDYQVRACNEFSWACSGYSAVTSDTQVRKIPATSSVTSPSSSSASNGQYNVIWSSSSEATYYNLQRRVDSGAWSTVASSTASTTFAENAVNSGFYEYRVKGCNEFSWSCSGYSSVKSIALSLAPAYAMNNEVAVNDATLVEPIVPANQAIGAVNGNGGVSGGAASYSIPVAIAPGRAGMQPNVGLSYSSRGGNGIAGVGWSLSAGGSVHRCAATDAQDGFTAAPQYDASRDRLCLNGQRLMNVTGTYGASGTVYRTELDNFARVTQTGSINSSSTYFTVESKGGRISYYGEQADARHSAEGRTQTLSWAISKEEDRAGNNITYDYSDQGEGEYTLDTIWYTGQGSSNGDRKVTFEYEARTDGTETDYHTSYLAGGKSRTTLRLKNVKTFYGATQIRQYNLTYGDMSLSSARTLLRSIEECGYKSGAQYCLPATTFDWQERATKYVLEPVEFSLNGSTYAANNAPLISDILPKGDINGDGTKDWPKGSGDGFLADAEFRLRKDTPRHTEDLGGCFHKSLLSFNRTCMTADFDQDGKSDSFKINSSGDLLISYSGSTSWIDTGIDLPYQTEKVMSFTDYNGDGWPDLTVYEADAEWNNPKVYLYTNTRNKSAPFNANQGIFLAEIPIHTPIGTYGSADFTQTIEELGDMDGNGTPDLMVSVKLKTVKGMPRPYKLLLSKSTANGGISFDDHYEFSGFQHSEGNAIRGEAYFFHDINGDGLSDWINASFGTLKYKLNLGGSFETVWTDLGVSIPIRDHGYELANQEPDYYSLPIMEKTTSMDYDGDGKVELLYADTVVASACSQVTHWGNSGQTTEWMCDEELWETARKEQMSQVASPIEGARKDVSARNYKAIFFTENADGSITASVQSTDIIAAPVERAAVDANGDGLVDMVTTFTCQISGCEFNGDATAKGGTYTNGNVSVDTVYINRNLGASVSTTGYEAIDVLKQVTNGLGVKNQWTYKPLSSGDYDIYDGSNNLTDTLYDADHDYINSALDSTHDNYFHFGSSMLVAQEHRVSNGIGSGLNATQYRYRGAVYNNQGRGFQGFRTVIVDNPSGVRGVTDFHQTFPIAGAIDVARTCLVADDDFECDDAPLSETKNGYYETEPVFGKTYWVIPAKSESRSFELNGRGQTSYSVSYVGTTDPDSDGDWKNLTVAAAAFDAYGNVLQSLNKVDSGFGIQESSTQKTFYSPNSTSWWINKLKTTTVTTKALVGDSRSVYNASLDSANTVLTTINNYDEAIRKPSKVTMSPTDGKANVVETIYNGYGLPTDIITKNGGETVSRSVSTTYSVDGYFVKDVTNLVGTTTTYVNEKYGQPDATYDANNVGATFAFDAFGRVEKTTSDGVPKSYLRYTDCNNCDGIGKPDVTYKVTSYSAGAPESTEYRDKLGRVILVRTQIFNGPDVYAHVEYDALGRKKFESVPGALTSGLVGTHYNSYDAIGRLTSKTQNQTDSQVLDVEYDYGFGSPHRTRINVNNGSRYLYRTYSGTGQLIRTTDALGTPGVTQYAYDGTGNPIVLKDANGEEITATYNDLGQKKWVNDPNMGLKTFTYTDFGEVDTETDAIGNVTNYDYDSLGRIVQRAVSGPNETSASNYEYDNPLSAGDKCLALPSKEYKGTEFSRTYHYNNLCQLISTKTTIENAGTFEVKTQYDSQFGRPKATTYPTGLTLAYEYSAEGYLKRTYNATTGYTYREVTGVDEQGSWKNANVANGNSTIVRNFNLATGQMRDTEWFNSSVSQQKLAYQYNEYGNLKLQSVTNGLASTSTESYSYDNMHRLTSTSRSVPGFGTVNYDFAYDAVGNIKKKTDFSADNNNAYTYGNSGRSSSNGWAGPNAVRQVILGNSGGTRTYSYDQNGNLISDGIRAIQYNAFNKPVQFDVTAGTINTKLDNQVTGSSSASLFYGSDQMRYKQVKNVNGDTSTHIYIGKIFEQVTKTVGSTTTTEKKSYIDDIAVITETTDSNSVTNYEVTYYHRDRLGSMTAEIDELGNLKRAHSYDAFGRPRNENMSDKTGLQQLLGYSSNRGFTDHEHLDESQLIHMNGRVYDFNLGRFLSVDPYIQEPGNSQSMNPYSYIMNNPMSGTDPSGYEAETKKKVRVQRAGSRITTGITVTATSNGSGTNIEVEGKDAGAVIKTVSAIGEKVASQKTAKVKSSGRITNKKGVFNGNVGSDNAASSSLDDLPVNTEAIDRVMNAPKLAYNGSVEDYEESQQASSNIEFSKMTQEQRLFYLFKIKGIKTETFAEAQMMLTFAPKHRDTTNVRIAFPSISDDNKNDTMFKFNIRNKVQPIMADDYKQYAVSGAKKVLLDVVGFGKAKTVVKKLNSLTTFAAKHQKYESTYSAQDVLVFYNRQLFEAQE